MILNFKYKVFHQVSVRYVGHTGYWEDGGREQDGSHVQIDLLVWFCGEYKCAF